MIEPTADTEGVIRARASCPTCGESIPRADLPVTIPDPDEDDEDSTPLEDTSPGRVKAVARFAWLRSS